MFRLIGSSAAGHYLLLSLCIRLSFLWDVCDSSNLVLQRLLRGSLAVLRWDVWGPSPPKGTSSVVRVGTSKYHPLDYVSLRCLSTV